MTPAKRMTWDEMVKTYPNKWLAITDPQMDGPDVVSGIVVKALTDRESDHYMDKHIGEKITYRRTTEGEWNGFVDSDFIIQVI